MKNLKAWKLVPALKRDAENNVVRCFYDNFRIGELEEKHKAKISELENFFGKKCKFKVIAVLEQKVNFPDGDCPTMTSYIYIDNKNGPWRINEKNVGFMACVVNDDWGMEDMGSIGVKEEFVYRMNKVPGTPVISVVLSDNRWIRRTM
jgi:hypothetical protein